MRVIIGILLVLCLIGCSTEVKTSDAVESQKEINAKKDPNWQD